MAVIRLRWHQQHQLFHVWCSLALRLSIFFCMCQCAWHIRFCICALYGICMDLYMHVYLLCHRFLFLFKCVVEWLLPLRLGFVDGENENTRDCKYRHNQQCLLALKLIGDLALRRKNTSQRTDTANAVWEMGCKVLCAKEKIRNHHKNWNDPVTSGWWFYLVSYTNISPISLALSPAAAAFVQYFTYIIHLKFIFLLLLWMEKKKTLYFQDERSFHFFSVFLFGSLSFLILIFRRVIVDFETNLCYIVPFFTYSAFLHS